MLTRTFDILAAFGGLLLLSPLFALVAFAIKLDSRGPIFYRAPRIGKDGVPFRLYKFRSMVADAHRRGPGITAASDSRITRVGRFLRRAKLDELPQLLNVFKGDMGLVGPRPEDSRYVALYTPEQRRVLAARPGITSPASLHYRNESILLSGDDWERVYVETVMPHKLAIELAYLSHRSFGTDLKVIFLTLWAVVTH
ncbi:MAG: sugar transferase [Chloroflexi bacterium]|nr:sugar transferase [Chloroflexota bacterium]